jgi:hypothetical protein
VLPEILNTITACRAALALYLLGIIFIIIIIHSLVMKRINVNKLYTSAAYLRRPMHAIGHDPTAQNHTVSHCPS